MKTCKTCSIEKVAEYSHLGRNGAKLYRDDKQRLWKGQQCPECQAAKRRESRKEKTALGQTLIQGMSELVKDNK